MAELTPWTPAQSRAQLAAVAWLRWRIFINSFRYKGKKRTVAKWIVIVIARILVWGIIAVFALGPIVACAATAYYAASHHRLEHAQHPAILGGLHRKPLHQHQHLARDQSASISHRCFASPSISARYLLIRLFFGFFAIPTVVANLSLAAAAIGIGVARPELFLWAALVLGIFALHNVFFIRMTFAWVDRWMATRRAREIFGGLVLAASLGFQLAVSGRPRPSRRDLRHTCASVRATPSPDAVSSARPRCPGRRRPRPLQLRSRIRRALIGLIAFALAALAILAMRLKQRISRRKPQRSWKARTPTRSHTTARNSPHRHPADEPIAIATIPEHATGLRMPPTIAACLQKELIYLKRSGAQLYGLFTPLFFVFILARRNKTLAHSGMLFPYAVSYMMFGLLANLYNVLGADGPGFNLYLLTPVRLRDVLVAKNLVNTSVIAIEILLALIAVTLITGGLPPAAMLSATLLWACFAVFVNLTVGNLRSLLAPMRFELGKARRAPVAKGGAFIKSGRSFPDSRRRHPRPVRLSPLRTLVARHPHLLRAGCSRNRRLSRSAGPRRQHR